MGHSLKNMIFLKKAYKLLLGFVNRLYAKSLSSRIEDRNFTIISNNCWGGELYKELNLAYNTPFIGLFIYAPCYIKMLKNLRFYLN